MELGLSLGDPPKTFPFLEKSQKTLGKELGFCMALGNRDSIDIGEKHDGHDKEPIFSDDRPRIDSSSDPSPVQLDLLPFSPVHKSHPSSDKFPFACWLNEKLGGESAGRSGSEVNRKLGDGTDREVPSSSFQMDFAIFRSSSSPRPAGSKRDLEQINSNNNNYYYNSSGDNEEDRGSDDDENGSMARKKLRLSKQQSAFLEESFKENSTLNPKQKLALAKHLNLRPRQVEVWFQNRRARTKLKQTEVDCEYLKKCCETLTEENRRLHKELQELRVLKASQPFYMQLPATTLTMCPSCERVATSGGGAVSPTTTTTAVVATNYKASKHFLLSSCHDNTRKAAS
ncbi:Homeobox-leucine zipper protein [Orobanche gracilis]